MSSMEGTRDPALLHRRELYDTTVVIDDGRINSFIGDGMRDSFVNEDFADKPVAIAASDPSFMSRNAAERRVDGAFSAFEGSGYPRSGHDSHQCGAQLHSVRSVTYVDDLNQLPLVQYCAAEPTVQELLDAHDDAGTLRSPSLVQQIVEGVSARLIAAQLPSIATSASHRQFGTTSSIVPDQRPDLSDCGLDNQGRCNKFCSSIRSSNENVHALADSRASSKRLSVTDSSGSTSSNQIGDKFFSVAGAEEDILDELQGTTSPTKKKRFPRVSAGYKCREPGCGKVFDYYGERTKHERVHQPESDRQHACTFCEKRFINRKDLHRHGKVHLGKRLSNL